MKVERVFLNLVTIIFSVCLVLLILDVGVRVFVPKSYWQFHDFTSAWQLDKVLGWVQKPNLDVTSHTEHGWVVRFQTNRDGLTPATAQRPRTPGKTRIMFIGDSTVLGYSVPQDKTVSAQHQQLFQRKGLNVEIINAGVEGYGTDQSLLLMERLIPLYHPDIVIYGLCQNDFGENQTREVHGQAKPIFKITHNGNAEMTPPVLKDKIYSGGSGIRKWIQYIALYRLLQPSMFKLRVKLFGWHNSKNGVTDDLDKLYVSPETLEAIDWNLFRYLLNRMKVISNTNGAQFLFYSHPALQEVWDPYIKNIEQNLGLTPGQYDRYVIENKLIKISNEENIVFIPMIDWFLKHSSEGPFHLLPRDPHCNSNGYRLIAERLSPYLSQLIIKNDASRN